MATNESRLIYDCMQLLGLHGAIFRTNAGQFYTKDGKPVSGLPKGFTDLLFVRKDGVPCFIELKVGKNKPSPEQLAFIEKMQSHNARAGIAHTPEEAAIICGLDNTGAGGE